MSLDEVASGSTGENELGQGSVDPSRLRILVHDFAGHPFQVDLSRELARRGHQVLHVHCESYTSGKGRFEEDHADLTVLGVRAGQTFARYAPPRRVAQEFAYGRRFARVASDFRPDIVLSCNVPLVAHTVAAQSLRRTGVPWVFWIQDLYSVALGAEAENRAGRAGRMAGTAFGALERALCRDASQIVTITDDFLPSLERWGIDRERCTSIENWAPLDDLPLRPQANHWRQAQSISDDRFVFLYSGTLGLKHRPELLFELAEQHVDDAEVVVISEGRGEAKLRQMLACRPLPNLRLLPFQPMVVYPDVLAAADVLVALLEPDAGTFSVPSKVLSYLCAGRPILAAIPTENLAARTVEKAEAGLVVPPTDLESFLLAAKRLRNDPALCSFASKRARRYAETNFDTAAITDRFLSVIKAGLGL